MKLQTISQALNCLNERHISETEEYALKFVHGTSERNIPMERYTYRRTARRFVTILVAACLLLSLGLVAYAAWSIHAARQQQLREDLQIEESKAESYVEFELNEKQQKGLVLLSTVNDGQEQRLYVNVSPISADVAEGFPESTRFSWKIDGTELWGMAAPGLPSELSLSGQEEIRKAVMEYAYDAQSQTMTLMCWLNVDAVKKLQEELGSDILPLAVNVSCGDYTESFGPMNFSLTEEQKRSFDFGPALYHDEALNKDMEIVALELTPFSAVWKVRYEGAEDFHRPNADWDAYRDWSILEDRVCIESKIYFSDGSSFSTGGALTTPYSDGLVNMTCGWGKAIDINDVQCITLGELILWENK